MWHEFTKKHVLASTKLPESRSSTQMSEGNNNGDILDTIDTKSESQTNATTPNEPELSTTNKDKTD